MAWLDERVWCHPKFTDLSDRAFRVWVCGNAYSSGFLTRGVLTAGQQRMIGSNKKIREELIDSELWDELVAGGDGIRIHDWDDHNAKRDEKRKRDRDRMRERRRQSRDESQDQSPEQSRDGRGDNETTVLGQSWGEGSDGSEGSERKALGLLSSIDIRGKVDRSLRAVS